MCSHSCKSLAAGSTFMTAFLNIFMTRPLLRRSVCYGWCALYSRWWRGLIIESTQRERRCMNYGQFLVPLLSDPRVFKQLMWGPGTSERLSWQRLRDEAACDLGSNQPLNLLPSVLNTYLLLEFAFVRSRQPSRPTTSSRGRPTLCASRAPSLRSSWRPSRRGTPSLTSCVSTITWTRTTNTSCGPWRTVDTAWCRTASSSSSSCTVSLGFHWNQCRNITSVIHERWSRTRECTR